MDTRAIAFYLPQFYPIPENDRWWGDGFTEWRNVVRCKPRFSWHPQPHLPADLGYYDLRVPEVRAAQAQLAREHGVHGFCYYHYWFTGGRLLERPFDEVLSTGEPDLPFCICWANEPWRRNWDGRSGDVLMPQDHNHDDDLDHIRWLCDAFKDSRYTRVQGKPLLLIYRVSLLPDAQKTIALWREEADRLGIGEIYVCRVESMRGERDEPQQHGCDAAIEFSPDWTCQPVAKPSNPVGRAIRKLGLAGAYSRNRVVDYGEFADRMIAKPDPAYTRFPCVTPMWDNSARRAKGATILRGSTPQRYEAWLRSAVDRARSADLPEPIVFINAWNEWAEGCHLEPCEKWGRAYLEATRRVLVHGGASDPDESVASQ